MSTNGQQPGTDDGMGDGGDDDSGYCDVHCDQSAHQTEDDKSNR